MNSRRVLSAALALAATGAALAPVATAAGPRITTPKLAKTQIGQYPGTMGVDVSFKISKADDQYPIKARICVLNKCKSLWVQKQGQPATSAIAEQIDPNVAYRVTERLGTTLKVTTTLYVGSKHWTYRTKAKVAKGQVG